MASPTSPLITSMQSRHSFLLFRHENPLWTHINLKSLVYTQKNLVPNTFDGLSYQDLIYPQGTILKCTVKIEKCSREIDVSALKQLLPLKSIVLTLKF